MNFLKKVINYFKKYVKSAKNYLKKWKNIIRKSAFLTNFPNSRLKIS